MSQSSKFHKSTNPKGNGCRAFHGWKRMEVAITFCSEEMTIYSTLMYLYLYRYSTWEEENENETESIEGFIQTCTLSIQVSC